MTLNEFGDQLDSLLAGETATLPYSIYEILFPPGEPDENARLRAFNFAREHGCGINNQTAAQQVVFIKRVTNPGRRNAVEPYNDFT